MHGEGTFRVYGPVASSIATTPTHFEVEDSEPFVVRSLALPIQLYKPLPVSTDSPCVKAINDKGCTYSDKTLKCGETVLAQGTEGLDNAEAVPLLNS